MKPLSRLWRREPTLLEKSIPYIGAAVAVGAAVGAYWYYARRRHRELLAIEGPARRYARRKHTSEVPAGLSNEDVDEREISQTLPLAET